MKCEFGTCLANLRRLRKRSQKFIAIAAELDPTYLAGLEHGRRPLPRPPLFDRLMRALEASEAERQFAAKSLLASKITRLILEHDPTMPDKKIALACGTQFWSEQLTDVLIFIVNDSHGGSRERQGKMII